jgi:hypothetical protein
MLATWEVEIKRVEFPSQRCKKSFQDLISMKISWV